MSANGQSNGSSAWPTAMAVFVILAVVVSVVSLGAVIRKSSGATVVATSTGATAAAPGFDFGKGPSDAFQARDPQAPAPSPQPAGTVTS